MMKNLVVVFSILCFCFLIQSSSCNYLEISNLSVEEIEAIYNSNDCAERDNTIIPCDWYADVYSPMPPIIAGMLDGAYVTGESIADLAPTYVELYPQYQISPTTERDGKSDVGKPLGGL